MSAIRGDLGTKHLIKVAIEAAQGARLVAFHETAIASDIGRQDGGETAVFPCCIAHVPNCPETTFARLELKRNALISADAVRAARDLALPKAGWFQPSPRHASRC
jgi:hypothetical protein